jgi:carboxyl-terminal processing protease
MLFLESMKFKHKNFLFLLCILLLLPKIGFCYQTENAIREVEEIIKQRYINNTNKDDIVEGALNGMLNSLDPYSSYFSKNDYKEFSNNTNGHFNGIGIEIVKSKDDYIISSVFQGSPADRAGIIIGDVLSKVDDINVTKIAVDKIVHKIRGERGTFVKLEIYRPRDRKEYVFSVARDKIRINSVSSKIVNKNNLKIALIEIKMFNHNTYQDFIKLLSDFNKNINALILDFRNNPGGLLDPAVEIANVFLKKGDLITTIKAKDGVKLYEYLATNRNKVVSKDIPIVLLVNKFSASSAEIVAAALKENAVATLIGEKTFGKASVQEIIELKTIPGSAIKLTIAKYYTPKGNLIHSKGITPDIESKDGKALEVALDFISKKCIENLSTKG